MIRMTIKRGPTRTFYQEQHFGGFGNNRQPSSTTREHINELNIHEYINRLPDNIADRSHDDVTWSYIYIPPRDYSSRFNKDFKKPVFREPKIEESDLSPKPTPVFIICMSLASVLFCVFCVIIIFVCVKRLSRKAEERDSSNVSTANPQERNSDNSNFSLLVNLEDSPQSNSYSDLPPPYCECVTNNDGGVNKKLDVTPEELPPPYCLETINKTDAIPKVHKGQSVEERQVPPVTAAHLNNIADTDENPVYACFDL